MPEIYPSTYPCPTWEYGQQLTAYPNRSPMECGWTRQRKRWPSTGSAVDLQFIMDTATFATWSAWIHDHGYDWFTIDLDRFGGVKRATDIRLVTPIQYRYGQFDKVIVTVSGEFYDADA